MEQKIKAKDVRVRLNKSWNNLGLTIVEELNDNFNKGCFRETFISNGRHVVYRVRNENGKDVYDYKTRVDIFEPDEGNQKYLVETLENAMKMLGVQIDENHEFSEKELLSLEEEILAKKQELVEEMEKANEAKFGKTGTQPGDAE